jgi:hypothetical protein
MKTAVEWLESEFVKLEQKIGVHHKMYKLIEQAKEMEKQQVNDKINTIHEQIKELYDNENITGFSKRAYAQCLDIVEQFKKK